MSAGAHRKRRSGVNTLDSPLLAGPIRLLVSEKAPSELFAGEPGAKRPPLGDGNSGCTLVRLFADAAATMQERHRTRARDRADLHRLWDRARPEPRLISGFRLAG